MVLTDIAERYGIDVKAQAQDSGDGRSSDTGARRSAGPDALTKTSNVPGTTGSQNSKSQSVRSRRIGWPKDAETTFEP